MKRSPLKRTAIKRKPRKLGRFRKPLRVASKKRAKRNREAAPVRQSFVQEVGKCEVCDSQRIDLVAHEIARADRANQYTERCCMLCVCGDCHRELHESPAQWSKVRQLALIWLKRGRDFDLARYNKLAIARVELVAVETAVKFLESKGQRRVG
jgi:superfamily II helicase